MVISIFSEKGGVAKTTTAAALGSILSRQGKRVVLVDLDSKPDLTRAFNQTAGERNIFDCIFNHRHLLAHNLNPNLVLVAGDHRMTPTNFSDHLKKDPDFQYENPRLILREVLQSSIDKADFILLDCPPNFELVTGNALACSNYLLIPTEANSFSVNGIGTVLEYSSNFTGRINKDLKILGIFLTRFRASTSIHSELKRSLEELYPEHMFSTVIHENTTVQEAIHLGKEFEIYKAEKARKARTSNRRPFRGLDDYRKLADELLTKISHETKNKKASARAPVSH